MIVTNPRLTAINAELGIPADFLAARGLSECTEAPCLVVAEIGGDGREHLLAPSAAIAWRELKAAAIGEGISLFLVSAFRSIDRQTEIFRRKLETGVPIEDILSICAVPGFSEHHTGHAIDLSTPGSRSLEVEFDRTSAFVWLRVHAAEFGYHLSYPLGNRSGYQYEPWHWCFHDAQSILPSGAARSNYLAQAESNVDSHVSQAKEPSNESTTRNNRT